MMDRSRYAALFLSESREHLNTCNQLLLEWERDPKASEPVTADIKRLIRLPGSIHGGSSFGVVPLTRKKLENFNPLEDAIIFTESPVRVLVTKPQEVEIKGKIWRVSEGVGRLPENVAMYLMCRGSAEYEP